MRWEIGYVGVGVGVGVYTLEYVEMKMSSVTPIFESWERPGRNTNVDKEKLKKKLIIDLL